MIKSNYIAFDTETGGVDENENPMTQFAAVILDGKTLKEIDRWETFIKPYDGLKIKQEALDKTMVTMSDINSGMSVKDFVNTATKFLESHRVRAKKREMGRLVPIGHNLDFDIRFMNYAFKLCGKPDCGEWMHPNPIDTYPLAKLTFGITGLEKLNLGAACKQAKLKITDAHGAMNDVEATANLVRWYMRKLRSTKSDMKIEGDTKRKRGGEFFEFKCKTK